MNTKTNRESGSLGMSDKDRMAAELRAKLEWYTKEAATEEFDPKAIESILYLLDIYEPLKEEYTNVDDAWERFEKRLEEQCSVKMQVNAGRYSSATESFKTRDAVVQDGQNRASANKVIRFVRKQKVIVAAVLVVLLLALIGTTQAEAIRQSGFFFWLRQDEEGRQMITSPESLESTLDVTVTGDRYCEWSEVPEWGLEALPVGENWQKKNLEWQYVNVIQFDNYTIIKSCYTTVETGEEVLVGTVSYSEKISVNTEVFGDYSYVECYDEGEKSKVYIYKREDVFGTVFYRLCRFADHEICFADGTDLELLRELIEEFEKR